MGTTVATNALLARAEERVLPLITAAFRDLLRIGMQARPDQFALNIRRADLLHEEVAEVQARHDAEGIEIEPLNDGSARTALRAAHRGEVRAVAIVLMHAHVNPTHEARLGHIAAEEGST